MKHSAHLKLPFEFDFASMIVRDCDKSKLHHFMLSINDLDTRVQKFIEAAGFQISHVESFYTPPRFMLSIHTDNNV